ncbi:hypothetical protein J6A31_05645 [bacterium]|nr:hypothetical protein [bacterium]
MRPISKCEANIRSRLVFVKSGYTVSFDNSYDVGNASTDDHTFDSEKVIQIGFKTFDKNNFNDFVSVMVSTFHEKRHTQQFNEMQQGTYDINNTVAYIAKQKSPVWYKANYSHLPYEIEAEKYGVMSTYKYLVDKFKNVDAEKCMVDFVKTKITKGDVRYTKGHFDNCETINDISAAFDNLYDECYSVGMQFMLGKNDALKTIYKSDDRIPTILSFSAHGIEEQRFLAACVLSNNKDLVQYFGNEEIKILNCDKYFMAYDIEEYEFRRQRHLGERDRAPFYRTLMQMDDDLLSDLHSKINTDYNITKYVRDNYMQTGIASINSNEIVKPVESNQRGSEFDNIAINPSDKDGPDIV